MTPILNRRAPISNVERFAGLLIYNIIGINNVISCRGDFKFFYCIKCDEDDMTVK